MKYDYNENNSLKNDFYFAENDSLHLDYDEIAAGIERGCEDIRCGRNLFRI